MKKLLVFTALVLFLSSLIALESDPSEVVGFVKTTATAGSYSYFSLPFTFYVGGTETMALDDIIGTQLTGGNIVTGDRIIEVGTGTYAYLNSSTNTWSGALTNFTDNYPYQYKVHTSHSTKDVYLAGNVEQEVQVMPYSCAIGYTMYGIREAGSVDVSALDLVDSGFTGGNVLTSDRFIDATSGSYAYYNTSTSAWAGGLTNIEPANVYKVKVQSSHTAFTWTYDPTDNPARTVNPMTKKIHSNMK